MSKGTKEKPLWLTKLSFPEQTEVTQQQSRVETSRFTLNWINHMLQNANAGLVFHVKVWSVIIPGVFLGF